MATRVREGLRDAHQTETTLQRADSTKTDTHTHFLTIPSKAKTHQMKTYWDVTSKIGFQRICCVKSLIKLVYFSTACLQQHSILKPDVPRRADCVECWISRMHTHTYTYCCVMTLVWENIKTKLADRHHYVAEWSAELAAVGSHQCQIRYGPIVD